MSSAGAILIMAGAATATAIVVVTLLRRRAVTRAPAMHGGRQHQPIICEKYTLRHPSIDADGVPAGSRLFTVARVNIRWIDSLPTLETGKAPQLCSVCGNVPLTPLLVHVR